MPAPSARAEDALAPSRLGQQVAAVLAADIVGGRIGLDAPFPSAQQVGERFGVSRTVAREAVQRLCAMRLLHVQQGRRATVLGPERWNVLDPTVQDALRREGRAEQVARELYDVRLLVEPAAAGWFAERGDGERLERLRRVVAELEAAAQAGREDVFFARDREFHELIASGSGNRILAAVQGDLAGVLAGLWSLRSLPPGTIGRALEDHREIAEAILARQPTAAAEAMRRHVRWAMISDLGG